MNRLQGKLALITGAASGLGAQIARRFTEEGATVVINDLRAADAEAMAEELGGDSMAVGFDVADSAAVEAGFKEVAERFGRLDILVNNAGFAQDAPEEERAERDRLRMQQIAEIQAGETVEVVVGDLAANATASGVLRASREATLDSPTTGRVTAVHL